MAPTSFNHRLLTKGIFRCWYYACLQPVVISNFAIRICNRNRLPAAEGNVKAKVSATQSCLTLCDPMD